MKKLISLTMLSLLSAVALADSTSQYKMAVIQGSNGAKEIRTGNYQKGISNIEVSASKQYKLDSHQQIAQAMNLCVAYANLQQQSKAQKACNLAISLVQQIEQDSQDVKNVASLAFNNRAIFKAKMHDYDGALQDLLAAMKIKESEVIEKNLLQLIQAQSNQITFQAQQLTKV